MGTVDGLGFEEVNQSVTSTAIISGTNVYAATAVTTPTGNITTVNSTTVNATTVSGTSARLGGNTVFAAGSPYGAGVVIPLAARSNISGGMWVSCSGGKAFAGPALAQAAFGVAVPGTNVASGGTVNVITHGIVPLIAEGTVTAGGAVQTGAGGALNTVKAAGAGSGVKYSTLDAAGSEGTVFVMIR